MISEAHEGGTKAGLLARLRTGTYDEEDLPTATATAIAFVAGDVGCAGLDREGVVDALIDDEYRLDGHLSAVQRLAAAGVDDRVGTALRDFAQGSWCVRAPVDAAEAVSRLGLDDDAEILVNAIRRMQDQEDLAYGVARLTSLGCRSLLGVGGLGRGYDTSSSGHARCADREPARR